MKHTVSLIVILEIIFSFTLFADDTLTAGTGDTLHPITSTNIILTDEVLNITKTEKGWDILVQYEFDNTNDEQNLEIAFVSINKHKNWDGTDNYTGNISNMHTLVNGEEINSKLETNDSIDYYTYKMKFLKGFNKVSHTYSLVGTIIGDPYSEAIAYKLTTGNNWSGPIRKLKIIVNFNQPEIISDLKPGFNIDGIYKNGTTSEFNTKYINLINGKLTYNAENYIAKDDIYIHLSRWAILGQDFVGNQNKISMLDLHGAKIGVREIAGLKKEQVRILRNAIFAYNGYQFKDSTLSTYFNEYGWYYPKIDNADIILNDIEKENVMLLKNLEDKL